MLSRIHMWLRATFLRGRFEREMRAEMNAHVERATERLMARGLTHPEAAAEAQREFGVVERLREEARAARGGQWLDAALQDLRFALRQYARRPLSATTIVLVLALGIGGNIVLFTFLHSVMTLPPPGVPRDDALVRIRRLSELSGRAYGAPWSYPEVRDLSTHTELFGGVAGWANEEVVLDSTDVGRTAIAATTQFVTDGYFDVLGIRPVLGTTLPARRGVASLSLAGVISHDFWTRRFGRSADVLGKAIEVNGVPITIVGVAPPRFHGVDAGASVAVWLPLSARSIVGRAGAGALESYDSTSMRVVARLAAGIDAADALPGVRLVAARAAAARSRPAGDVRSSADVVPLRRNNQQPRNIETVVEWAALAGLGVLVLLITCVTASTLLVGLAAARRREIAVRLSLGAGRTRLIRQLVTESMLLACTAGVLGLLLTYALIRTVAVRIPDLEIVLAWPSVAFMVGAGLLTGLLFGISPALHATRLAVAEVLKDAASAVSASRSWLQRGLVVTQIALTQPMLVGLCAVMLIVVAGMGDMRARPVLEHVVSASFRPFAGIASVAQGQATMARLIARFEAMPGVVAVVPQTSGYSVSQARLHPADRVDGSPTQSFPVRIDWVAPGQFALLDVPILRGREFTREDGAETSTAIIVGNEVARDLWGNADPIGRRILIDTNQTGDSVGFTVVGLVDEAALGHAGDGRLPIFFPPRFTWLGGTVLIRTAAPATTMFSAIRAVAAAEAPDMPIDELTTLAAEEREIRRFVLRVSGAAGAGGLLALLLSAIGLFAVVAFAIGQQTREIGIRTALGADRRRVVGEYFTGGIRLAAMGLVLGLPLSLFAMRVFSSFVGAPRANTTLLAATVSAVVLAVSCIAIWLPARRAAAVDPLTALRSD
jgi:predicted permease